MGIVSNLKSLISSIPSSVTLVAVSKTKPNSDILSAYHSGQRIFGENRVQELEKKQKELPADIQWHMIGHLQTNKVKYIAPFVSLIHAVDSLRLLDEIRRVLFRGAADFADHHDALGLVVAEEHIDAVDKIGAVYRIAADTDTGRLAETGSRRLGDRFIGQRARSGHDPDLAALVNMAGHDANFTSFWCNYSRAVWSDKNRT